MVKNNKFGYLWAILEELYTEKGEVLQSRIEEIVGENLLDSGQARMTNFLDKHWYKKLQMYVVYADSFTTVNQKSKIKNQNDKSKFKNRNKGRGDFYTLTEKLEYIRELGCNAIHVLPFLESPMVDGGFDVSDYYKVRENLGGPPSPRGNVGATEGRGNEAFEKFLAKAKSLRLKVFMDLVLNHVSEEHEWFRKAVAGEGRYRNYFIWQKEKPELVKTFEKGGKLWARYRVRLKRKSQSSKPQLKVQKLKQYIDLLVVFSDFVGEIPHWRQGKDGYWYFHSFYPQQLDLNCDNPKVLIEMAKVLIYWANKGLSFRLDAIGHLGKDEIT